MRVLILFLVVAFATAVEERRPPSRHGHGNMTGMEGSSFQTDSNETQAIGEGRDGLENFQVDTTDTNNATQALLFGNTANGTGAVYPPPPADHQAATAAPPADHQAGPAAPPPPADHQAWPAAPPPPPDHQAGPAAPPPPPDHQAGPAASNQADTLNNKDIFFQAIDGPTHNASLGSTTSTAYNVSRLMTNLSGLLKVIVSKDLLINGAMGFFGEIFFFLSPYQVTQARVFGPVAYLTVNQTETRNATLSETWFQILSRMMRDQLAATTFLPVEISVVLSAQRFLIPSKTTKLEFFSPKGVTVTIDISKCHIKKGNVYARIANPQAKLLDINLGSIAGLNPSIIIADPVNQSILKYPEDIYENRANAFFEAYGRHFNNNVQATYEAVRADFREVHAQVAAYERDMNANLNADDKFYAIKIAAAKVAIETFKNTIFEGVGAQEIIPQLATNDQTELGLLEATRKANNELERVEITKLLISDQAKYLRFDDGFNVSSHVYAPVHQPVFSNDALVTFNDAFDDIELPSARYIRAENNVIDEAMQIVVGVINQLPNDTQVHVLAPLAELVEALNGADADRITMIERFVDATLQGVNNQLDAFRQLLRDRRGSLRAILNATERETQNGDDIGETQSLEIWLRQRIDTMKAILKRKNNVIDLLNIKLDADAKSLTALKHAHRRQIAADDNAKQIELNELKQTYETQIQNLNELSVAEATKQKRECEEKVTEHRQEKERMELEFNTKHAVQTGLFDEIKAATTALEIEMGFSVEEVRRLEGVELNLRAQLAILNRIEPIVEELSEQPPLKKAKTAVTEVPDKNAVTEVPNKNAVTEVPDSNSEDEEWMQEVADPGEAVKDDSAKKGGKGDEPKKGGKGDEPKKGGKGGPKKAS